MKTIISSLLVLSCLFSSCKKDDAIVEDFIIASLYYRLELVGKDSTNVYSNIIATKTPVTFIQSKVQSIEIPKDNNDDNDDDYEPKDFCMKYPNSIKCKALPVLLEYFKIDRIGSNYITLKWKSLDETNFNGYNVQRSRDAKTYTNIAQIKAKGSLSEYIYMDKIKK